MLANVEKLLALALESANDGHAELATMHYRVAMEIAHAHELALPVTDMTMVMAFARLLDAAHWMSQGLPMHSRHHIRMCLNARES